MKTAICLHGYFGTVSTGNFSTSTGGYYHLMERVKPFCESVDFFVHCWQPEMESKIVKLYNPKNMILEEQIDFNPICQVNNIRQSYNDENFPRSSTMYKNAIFSSSNYKVISLDNVSGFSNVITKNLIASTNHITLAPWSYLLLENE